VASPEPGAVAWLYYADRVYQLPLGILAVAIGVALLPELARHCAAGDGAGEREALSRAAEVAAFLALPAALALVVAAEPIVGVLFQRGAFGPRDTSETAAALAAFAIGLPAFVGAKLVQPLFFARTRMRLPFMIALGGVATDVALAVLLFPRFGATGIAAAAAVSGWVNLLLLVVVARRLGYGALDAAACRRIPALLAATLAMGTGLVLLVGLLEPWTGPDAGFATRLAALAAICGGGLALYLAAAFALGGIDRAALAASFSGKRDTPPEADRS
jgi:putative peptidoglycan lipid II flippase